MLLFLRARRVKASSRGLSSTSKITLFSISSLLEIREREIEGCPLIHLPFSPDAPAVPVDDALDGCQANTCPLEFVGRMQALKRAEQFIGIGHVESCAIVADVIDKLSALFRLQPGCAQLSPL